MRGIRNWVMEALLPAKTGPSLPGEAITCADAMYGGKVFYVYAGKRHWVPSPDHLAHYRFPEVRTVGKEEMEAYRLAGPVPMPWPDDAWKNPDRGSFTNLREIATSRLRGSGIEFGAGTTPLSVPLGCNVQYADIVGEQGLRDVAYQAQGSDFVPVTHVMGLEDMDAVADGSLDFVIACHVIEHVRNPLRAFQQVYRKLKRNGFFVLIVPDMQQTFDKDRKLTSLAHIISDYKDPSEERDKEHYFEFFGMVMNVPEVLLDQFVPDAMKERKDLHYHTWTYETFQQMVEYGRRSMTPWKSVWSQPTIDGWLEFYFVLQK
jgi:SAM-dependent methyltransferase